MTPPLTLHILTHLDFGGVESRMRVVAAHAGKSVRRHALCAIGQGGAVMPDIAALGLRVDALGQRVTIPSLAATRALYRHIRLLRPSVVHLHGAEANFHKPTCPLANALGGIVVLREPAALYRPHPSTLTGDYAIQTLRQRLDKALPVGSNHYAFLAEVATETAEYLRRVAKNTEPAKASNLVASARSFDKLSRFHTARADLYSSTKVTERLAKFSHIARAGGYVGPPMVALGWKSAAKDLLCVLGLLGGRAKRAVR